jgi:phenylpropionate dioxygenase-like ring-hydroxylating dioxygenase large terminal subunit
MLSAQDNDLLCRTGAGTPMGDLMRQYWIPALMPDELPAGDSPPMRVRLLGENLIAFRVSSGAVGLIANSCPHRGASLFFGRNEEEGLRCVYHGWKFDVDGNCVDMPSEPAESNFKTKVKATTYPCVERNGVIWTYMGPRETPPPLPDFLPNLSPECRTGTHMRECNWMQALEGDIDTLHWGFLHAGHVRPEDCLPGSPDFYASRIRSARLEVMEHEAGLSYGAYRHAEETTDYWRMANFLMPFYTMNPTQLLGKKTMGNAWVPIDDDHCMVWGFNAPTPGATTGPGVGGLLDNRQRGQQQAPAMDANGVQQRGANRGFIDNTSDWLGRWRTYQNPRNDYLIDREAQAKMEIFSGIPNGARPAGPGHAGEHGPDLRPHA